MLKKILFLFMFAICSLAANAFEPNWAIVDSLDTSESKWGTPVTFINVKTANGNDIIALANVAFISPHIIKSTDGGFSWEIKLRFEEKPFVANEISVPDNNFAIFVCDSGVYFKSTDNGESWEKYRFENHKRTWRVSFWDSMNGIVFQSRKGESQEILKTTNGGNDWFTISGPETVNQTVVSYLFTLGEGICLAIEVDNIVDNTYYIHKSTDYGETWTTYSGPEVPPYGDFYFYNENLGFCLGGEDLNLPGGESKLIRRTSDGGKTWERVLDTIFAPNNRVVSVHFSDSLNGAASTLKDVLLTHDGGLTWYVDSLYKSMKFPAGITEILMLDKDNILGVAFNPYEFIYRYTGVDPSSVSQSFPIKQLKLFPNPTHELLQIELADAHIYNEYLIYDAKGALLQKSMFTGEVPIGNLPTGAYNLLLYSPTRTGYGHFVKE